MADEEEEKSRGFKVEDRRRFSAEGEPRANADEPVAENPAARQRSEASAAAKSPGRGAERSAPASEITFAGFVVGLSTQALLHLGEIQEPSVGGGPDLSAAQEVIDVLGMLQQKTRGNLDKNEQDLLEAILFDLRMKYVERSRRG
ncbi:MAG TPA: DUF1844 domain-containing protein [Candidatus Binataceae bacterium]|jgi:hypothetical protein|nr:DUF1844 domain-containing protein [Candidatus Binataceae bacterium]